MTPLLIDKYSFQIAILKEKRIGSYLIENSQAMKALLQFGLYLPFKFSGRAEQQKISHGACSEPIMPVNLVVVCKLMKDILFS